MKVISGGQTGVDQAALKAALSLNIPCGGWCPPGRICETGRIPDQFPLMETPGESSDSAENIPRSLRTEWNVRDADATLILIPTETIQDKGTGWTMQCVKNYRKPYLVVNPCDLNESETVAKWLGKNSFMILNIAGPPESSFPGIGSETFRFLLRAFKMTGIADTLNTI